METLRILLVEDDPTSRGFLAHVLEGLPASVHVADSVRAALSQVRARAHDLWLFDARLPDGSAASLLQRLREMGLDTPAMAHTAASDTSELEALRGAGFETVLRKPISATALRDAVRSALFRGIHADATAHGSGSVPATPRRERLLWDDIAALEALNHRRDHVVHLRGLFLDDLPGTAASLSRAWQENAFDRVVDGLHRLRAACAFVGAARLLDAVETWQRDPAQPVAREAFEQALRDTLDHAPADREPA